MHVHVSKHCVAEYNTLPVYSLHSTLPSSEIFKSEYIFSVGELLNFCDAIPVELLQSE